jgi:hypothetical protein
VGGAFISVIEICVRAALWFLLIEIFRNRRKPLLTSRGVTSGNGHCFH